MLPLTNIVGEELENVHFENFQAGKEKGFDYVYRKYSTRLSFFAHQLLNNDKDSAENVVQDCFVKLWNRRNRIEHIDDIKNYLYTSVRYSCLKLLAKGKINQKRHKGYLATVDISEKSVDNLIVIAETVAHIHQYMATLPPRMQQVFKMYYIEGKKLRRLRMNLASTSKQSERQDTGRRTRYGQR